MRLARIPDWGESIAVDGRGRMFATAHFSGRVYRVDAPGGEPVALTRGIGANGGIVVRGDRQLLVGAGNDLAHSPTGDLFPTSRLPRVDPDSGAVHHVRRRSRRDRRALGGRNIGRVTPDGRVVVTHTAGQIWRAEEGRPCAVESGPGLRSSRSSPTGEATAASPPDRLYRAGVDGEVYGVPVGAGPGR